MRGLPSIASAFASLEDTFSHRSSFIVVIFFFIASTSLVAQSSSEDPEYLWISKADLPSVTVSDMNTEDLTISVATDPQGNVYALSFGDGVDKRDANGVILEEEFISPGELDSPLDIAIDEEGYIYIADFLAQGTSFEDNGKIKVFNPQGDYLPERTILTSFYRPLGLDVNSDKVFVAEFNDGNSGPERTQLSRIRVYDKVSKSVLEETTQVQVPFRIAVNSQEQIYVSQAGNNDPDVLVFDSSLGLLGELPNIISPGSVVVDNLDYVYVLEYENRIDFSEFINFVELGLDDILGIAGQIKRGSDNEEFVIKIFDPSNSFLHSVVNNIDFPVDLTFNDCDRMYVNNSEVFGSTIPFLGFFPSRMEFDLEIYERTPSFDIEAPIAQCIPAGREYELASGEITISIDDINDGSTDNCGIESMSLSQSTFTTPGEKEIILTVTDFSGNSDSCTTTVTIVGPATELTINCPDPQLQHKNENCQFIVPDYTEMASPSDPNAVVTQSPEEGEVIEESTEVILTATLGDQTASCEFQLDLIDRTHVEFECPGNKTDSYDASIGYELPDYTQEVSLQDNCDPNPLITQVPLPGTSVKVRETEVVIRVEDASGNVSVCSFFLILTEDPEPLQFTFCPEPEPRILDINCQSVIPDLTGSAVTNNPGAQITQNPPAGQVVQGTTAIDIQLTATLGEESVDCNLSLQLLDETPPVVECPGDMMESYDPAVGFVVPDFSSLVQSRDACGVTGFSQFPEPGTSLFGDTEVQLRVTDASGNSSVCNFHLLLEEISGPSFECPETEDLPVLELNEECKVDPTDFSGLLSLFENFDNEPYFVQTEVQNVNILSVHIEVYDGAGGPFVGECDFDIPLWDFTLPQIDCPGATISLSQDENGKYMLPDFSNRASDTCDSELEVVQDPPPGEISSGGPVTLIAVDDSGNASEICQFEVVLLQEGEPDFDCPAPEDLPEIELEEDCSYVTPNLNELLSNFRNFDDSPLVVVSREQIGTVLHVNLKVYDGEEQEALFVKECSFQIQLKENFPPQATCVQEISIRLSENGSRTLSPEEVDNGSTDGCGLVAFELSQNTFTTADLEISPIEVELTVTDVYGNTDTCTVLVTVEPYEPGEPEPVTCTASVTLPLGADGEAQLNLEELYQGDLGPEGSVSVDKEFFTCLDLGVQTINLTYTGTTSGSCNIEVTVVDEIAPTAIAADLEISLDENGAASISAEDLNNGSTDNCGTAELQFTADQTSFNCSDVGINSVTFTVTDSSGNSAAVNVNVIVNDPLSYCAVDPVDPPEESFVFLFPNPSRGQVQIATSTDIILERVEIFDIRGRFLDALELTKNGATDSYHLDLQKFQTGVYTLKLYTGEREYIRRAIITTF